MRKKRILIMILTVLMLLAMVMVGCDKETSTSGADETSQPEESTQADTPATEEASGEAEEVPTEAMAFEDIVFPDSLPATPILAEDGMYDYSFDDMSEKYEVEILSQMYTVAALPADEDPINIWLSEHFNLDITFTLVAKADAEQVLNTRFAGSDEPDLMYLPNRDLAFALSEQGLLVDAKTIYPYMPHTQNYVTKTMIQWSTNGNGEIPFITKYAIQDGVFGLAFRQDWLDTLGMEIPTTKAELLEFAKAVTFEDPDGNGVDDTYFMTGAGAGKGWGMLNELLSMTGNPEPHVENGELSYNYFNGVYKEYLMLLNELYEAGVLAPDWFTIEWDPAKQYTHNDKIAVVRYPSGALFSEYTAAKEYSMESLDVWTFAQEPIIEGGKYSAAGNPGYMFGFSAAKFEDEGKVKRLAHMLDTMVYGGENYFSTIQSGTQEVYENAGIEVQDGTKYYAYNDENFFYMYRDETVSPWDPEAGYKMATAPWQVFGLAVSWQLSPPSDDEFDGAYAEITNKYIQYIAQYDRWEPTSLLVTLTDEAAEASSTLSEWCMSMEYKFVVGELSFDEWDSYTQEWLDKGGKKIIAQTAEAFGVPIPDYAN